MKPFKKAIKDICALIAYIGPILIVALDNFNIVFKVTIATITFFYNAFYHYRASDLEREFIELKHKHKSDVERYEKYDKNSEEYLSFYKEQLDIALTQNETLRQEIETYKKAGEL